MASILIGPQVGHLEWPLTLEDWNARSLGLSFDIGSCAFSSFTTSDTLGLLEIRNDPGVLPFMPSRAPLPLAQHQAWVNAHLLGGDAAAPLVLLGRHGGRAAGFGVIKPTAEKAVFEVGVMAADTWQRGGLPARLATALAVVAARLLGAGGLLTHVHPSHTQALRFNRAWGAHEAPSSKLGELCFRIPLEPLLASSLLQRCTRDLELQVTRLTR